MAWNTMAELTRIKLLNKRVRYAYTHTHEHGAQMHACVMDAVMLERYNTMMLTGVPCAVRVVCLRAQLSSLCAKLLTRTKITPDDRW